MVFNFSLVSKKFYDISKSHKYFVDKMRTSKYIFGSNFYYPDFLLKELLKLNKETSDTFKDSLIKKKAFLFNLIVAKLKELFYATIQNTLLSIFLSSSKQNCWQVSVLY